MYLCSGVEREWKAKPLRSKTSATKRDMTKSNETPLKIKSATNLLDLPNREGALVVYDKQNLAIKNVNGYYHLYYGTQFSLEERKYVGEPIAVCDKFDIESTFYAYTAPAQTELVKSKIHKAVFPWANEMGKGVAMNGLSQNELYVLGSNLHRLASEAEQELRLKYAVVQNSEGAESIISKFRTLSDAVAWCALSVEELNPVDIEVVNDPTYFYAVYELNGFGEIDELAEPVYKTMDYLV